MADVDLLPVSWQSSPGVGRLVGCRFAPVFCCRFCLLRRSQRLFAVRVQQAYPVPMPDKPPFTRVITPPQCEHASLNLNDNGFVPAVLSALVGDNEVA